MERHDNSAVRDRFETELANERQQKSEADRIDPADVDVLTRRKRRPRGRKQVPMPATLKPYTAKAKARLEKMPASPGIMLEPDPDGSGTFTSPHDDLEAWEIQIYSAFGTRSTSAMRTFVYQLRALCERDWHGPEKGWAPNERELNAAVNFVNSIQPKNEAQAALAAQMLAVHWMQMRMSAQALKNGAWIDHRDAAIAGKLARTFAMQMDTLARLQGKRQTARQTIRVKKELHQHVHYHDHRGAGERDGQSHARDAAAPDERAALPSENKGGDVVPISRRSR